MIFKRKNTKCKNCGSETTKKFSFCPYCGFHLNKEKDKKKFGLLGKSPSTPLQPEPSFTAGGGFKITDKFISAIINRLMKGINKQLNNSDNFKDLEKTEIKALPTGIKIRIGPNISKTQPRKTPSPQNKHLLNKKPSSKQIEKISKLPRASAKTSVKRLCNKVIYELVTPGLTSTDDVFISKLESGYEIKALGNKKMYVNTIPINLPLRGFSLIENKLFLEFKLEEPRSVM
jgi:hypothetical protein